VLHEWEVNGAYLTSLKTAIFAIASSAIFLVYKPPVESKPPSQLEKDFYYWFDPAHRAVNAKY